MLSSVEAAVSISALSDVVASADDSLPVSVSFPQPVKHISSTDDRMESMMSLFILISFSTTARQSVT